MLNIFLGLISAIGLMFTGWFFIRPDIGQWSVHIPADEPDMFIEQMRSIKFGPEGQPLHQLSTAKLVHYPKDNQTILTAPRMSVSYRNHLPWQIDAAQGKTRDGTEVLTLTGNVRMRQPEGPEHPARTVITDEIIYYPDKQFATTNTPVTMQQPGLQISAVGMNADIEKENVELLSEVKIRYHSEEMPASAKPKV